MIDSSAALNIVKTESFCNLLQTEPLALTCWKSPSGMVTPGECLCTFAPRQSHFRTFTLTLGGFQALRQRNSLGACAKTCNILAIPSSRKKVAFKAPLRHTPEERLQRLARDIGWYETSGEIASFSSAPNPFAAIEFMMAVRRLRTTLQWEALIEILFQMAPGFGPEFDRCSSFGMFTRSQRA
jgi:hypothetical protein